MTDVTRPIIMRPGEGPAIDLADRYGMDVIGPVPEGYL